MSEVENTGPSDDELLNEVLSDEATDSPDAAEEIEEQPEQVRDEAGRFAKKDAESEVVADGETQKPAVDDNTPLVPSWRVREINEEKRALADKVASLEAERHQWQQRQEAPKPVEQPKVEEPDPLLDPKAYREFIREETRNEILNDRREASLLNAHKTYKTEFEEAYANAQKSIDPALKARMQNSRDPGETLIEWYRESKIKAEVGNDPAAYKQRLRDEALKDPEFRKTAMAAWQSETQLPNGRPRVDLPPSLNGASRANTVLKSSNDDVSDEDLFQELAG